MIKFGTSGWRAIIADEFTFAAVRRVTQAIANHLQVETAGSQVIVGYDTRFMAEVFAAEAANILAANGFRPLLCDRPTPTPAISYAIRARRASGAINFTASHNPPQYCGMKFSTADGAPALPEVTGAIEREIQRLGGGESAAAAPSNAVESLSLVEDYLGDLAKKIDFATIAKAGLRVVYDPLWGTGRGYLNKALAGIGCEVVMLHDWRDVYFGGHSPEPDEEYLHEMRDRVIEGGYHLGLSTDGDADRFGILDRDGKFITPNQVIALLVDYLAESRGWTDAVARSVATTHLVDRVAARRDIKVYETPVGFKYIGQLITEDKIGIGGEESAGLSLRGHFPEKDGILACLLVAEMVARRGTSVGEMVEQVYRDVGKLVNGRIGVRLTPALQQALAEKLASGPAAFGGRRVETVSRVDGAKFILEDGAWLLMRPSGTEPLVRIYAEAGDEQELEVLLESGRKYILGESR
ncbi:MAG TPA: phosphoglucomutase/phosphomannomutase family protein [Blastocatellia bacterium]|nr:phosphoglucomutase/phosphomannomutase family protein [Blastocatellia bacterium]